MTSRGSWLRRLARRQPSTPARRGPARPSPSYGDAAVAATAPPDLTQHLVSLREDCVERVNQAVAEGRLDLVAELVAGYTDEALVAITAAPLEP